MTLLNYFDAIIFDFLTGNLIKRAALNIHGAAGLSGVDAYGWKCLYISFNEDSVELCWALVSGARCLSTTTIEPAILMSFVACRLIPLDKWSGVKPIGIGNVPHRIVAKSILYVIGDDIALAAGPLQTWAGHLAGSEAAIHAMKDMFMILTEKLLFWLMLLMHSIVQIAKLPCIIYLSFVQHFLLFLTTLVPGQSDCL